MWSPAGVWILGCCGADVDKLSKEIQQAAMLFLAF
jgi:hypothetical protein